MRNRRKQYNNRNVVQGKEDVAPFQVKEEKLLAKNKILPDSASDEGVKTIKTSQDKKNPWKFFCRNILKKSSHVKADMQRHKKIIPVTRKQMGDSGKPKTALNIQESKKLI